MKIQEKGITFNCTLLAYYFEAEYLDMSQHIIVKAWKGLYADDTHCNKIMCDIKYNGMLYHHWAVEWQKTTNPGWHPGLPPELEALTLLWTNFAKWKWNDPQLVLTLNWSFQFLFDPQFDLPIQRDTCQSRVDWFLVYSVEHLVHWVFVVLHFCNKPLVQWSCWKQLLSEICQIHDIMI